MVGIKIQEWNVNFFPLPVIEISTLDYDNCLVNTELEQESG